MRGGTEILTGSFVKIIQSKVFFFNNFASLNISLTSFSLAGYQHKINTEAYIKTFVI